MEGGFKGGNLILSEGLELMVGGCLGLRRRRLG